MTLYSSANILKTTEPYTLYSELYGLDKAVNANKGKVKKEKK